MKCCIKCNIEKDDGEYASGRNVCKTCRKEQKKQYYKNNQEEIKKYDKQYRQNNQEAIKKYNKQYRQNNQEEIKKYKIQYRQNNLEKDMIRRARRRAKQKNVPFNISEEDINIPNVCPVLGIPLETGAGKGAIQPNSPSLDRIIPEKGYVKGNIIVVSNKANTMKSNATPKEIITVGEFYKKLLEEAKKNE
jgi:hypothetical protein